MLNISEAWKISRKGGGERAQHGGRPGEIAVILGCSLSCLWPYKMQSAHHYVKHEDIWEKILTVTIKHSWGCYKYNTAQMSYMPQGP